jgi:hypothetical protein
LRLLYKAIRGSCRHPRRRRSRRRGGAKLSEFDTQTSSPHSPATYVSIRQHASEYVTMRQENEGVKATKRQKTRLRKSDLLRIFRGHIIAHIRPTPRPHAAQPSQPRQRSSFRGDCQVLAYVRMREHTSAYVSIRQHTPPRFPAL